MYDMFLRKEAFEDKSWYNQLNIFFAIGICEVPGQDVKDVREALARFLYGTRVVAGETPRCSYIIGTTAIDQDEMDAYIQSVRNE